MNGSVLKTALASSMLLALAACSDLDKLNSGVNTNESRLTENPEKGTSSSASGNGAISGEMQVFLSENELSGCTDSKEGLAVWVVDKASVYTCKNGRWEGSAESSLTEDLTVYKDEEALPNCTESREGAVAYLSDKKQLFTCNDGRWVEKKSVETIYIPVVSSSSATPFPIVMSSSSMWVFPTLSSSSIAVVFPVILSSSSNAVLPIRSSSSAARSSSSYKPVASTFGCGDMWCGADGLERVETGLDYGDDNSGYWFVINDKADGGYSYVTWPVKLGNEYDDNSMQPVVEYCGGICGSFTLDKGVLDYDPFVMIGFNVAGNDVSGKAYTTDASIWGGICIEYSSTVAGTLELGLGDALDASIGYANPAIDLPKATAGKVVDVPWSKFAQPAWGKTKISIAEAVASLAQVKVKFQAKTGTTGDFNITSIGRYGSCTGTVVRPSSSSSARPRSSSSKNSVKVGTTWYGADGDQRVDTGLDVGYDNSGYWYYYTDEADGGASTVTWAVPIGDEWNEYSLQPVVEYCGGVCGKFELDKGTLDYDPFVGIGINVGGQEADGKAIPVNASSKSGVCIAYTVTSAAILELGLGDRMDAAVGYANPAVDLPKSATGIVKEFTWDKFKQPSWAKNKITIDEAVQSLATIKFKIQAKTGTTGDFNIMSIGDYNGGCSTY